MSLIYGVVAGVVKDLDDPQGEGRIRVDFPDMEGQNRSYWAPVSRFMAGNGRGAWFMPELEDEVLLAFEKGDVNFPYVIGFLWNGEDRPPESDAQNRVIVTTSGHTVRFEDAGGKIIIRSSGGLTITLDDTDQSIQLQGGGRILAMREGQVQIS